MVYPIVYRLSTILLVAQDFATIHRMKLKSQSSGSESSLTASLSGTPGHHPDHQSAAKGGTYSVSAVNWKFYRNPRNPLYFMGKSMVSS